MVPISIPNLLYCGVHTPRRSRYFVGLQSHCRPICVDRTIPCVLSSGDHILRPIIAHRLLLIRKRMDIVHRVQQLRRTFSAPSAGNVCISHRVR